MSAEPSTPSALPSGANTIADLQRENARLRALLSAHGISAEQPQAPSSAQAQTPAQHEDRNEGPSCSDSACSRSFLRSDHRLTKAQVERYSRQLLLPSFGLKAQEGLCRGSVLIVGCGGLGSPAALYLAAAGVGRIGLVDQDVVDLSNLHRQIIHTESAVGTHKALSAAQACRALNSLVTVETHIEGFRPDNAVQLVSSYDVVLDASDNPPTRYLVSDACVVAGKPLVSAAAVGTDGQLTVYNCGPDVPCYRCLFPEAPAPENCSRCVDAGVLGPVPGVMGVLQALEVVKLLGGVGDVLGKKMLIFDGLSGRFTSVKLRTRRPECVACGDKPSITAANLHQYDYVSFTGQAPQDGPLPPISILTSDHRITVEQFKAILAESTAGPHTQSNPSQGHPAVLDVRPRTQAALFSFPHALHVPFEQLETRMGEVLQIMGQEASPSGRQGGDAPSSALANGNGVHSVGPQGEPRLVVLCRRGNNSQRVVARLQSMGVSGVVDVIGGVDEWIRLVQREMPSL